MSRIARPIPTATRRLNWKLALPILGLAACAALYAHANSALAAPARDAAPMRHHVMLGHGDRDNAYALVRAAGDSDISGDSDDWQDAIDAAKRSIKGEFLWFRHDGKAYVVQDPAVLAKAKAAWAPVDRLGEQMDGYGRQMDQHGKKMEALGQQMEQEAAKFHPDEAATHDFERKMEALSRRMDELASRLANASDAERAGLRHQMDQLGEQMGALGGQFGQRQAAQAGVQRTSAEAAAQRMRDASKPMEELGKQMRALGAQMKRESTEADKTVRELIRASLANGSARPAPAAG